VSFIFRDRERERERERKRERGSFIHRRWLLVDLEVSPEDAADERSDLVIDSAADAFTFKRFRKGGPPCRAVFLIVVIVFLIVSACKCAHLIMKQPLFAVRLRARNSNGLST